MGPTLRKAMADPEIVEVMLNPDGVVWVDRLGSGMSPLCEMAEAPAMQFLGTVAHMLETSINHANPKVEGELPGDGSRVEGLIPPIVQKPSFCLRKKASSVFPLDDYIEQDRITAHQAEVLRQAIKDRKNILVVGGTGSGKTTFCNAMLREIKNLTPAHRLVILEDTVELQCTMENHLSMRTTTTLSMRDLLKITMRTRPDRIIVGEVRDGSALDLLKAWNTGHPGGLSTVHANSAKAGLLRLEQLISEVSQAKMRDLIAEAINICVFLQRDVTVGPKITEVLSVKGVMNGEYLTEPL
ncbi:P-type conjugative transfer ATPase TrbB [Jonquetella anthropi E3_33 E1]|nr:P-type conjugative transfer ATPase TrbB [Jonquetella anthropi E3_33 E1]